jgi:hypothetical protein
MQKELEDMWCNESTTNDERNLLKHVLVLTF